MIVLQYDPYTQTAKFQNQNEENGHVSDFIHLSKEQKDALNMLKKDIILQNQIENLLRVLKEIDSSQSFRFIGTTKDYLDFNEGLKQLAPGGTVKKVDSPFFYDATYIRDQLTSICDAVHKDVEALNQKYPEHGGTLHFDSTGINAALNDRTPLVFMGKGSTGKSSVINALIGAEVLPTGDGTTTEAVCEIIPDEHSFQVSCKQGNTIWEFDFNKSKNDAELSLKNAFGIEVVFGTESHYDWVYRTVELINEQDDITNFQIRIPFKNLAEISKQIVIYDTPGPDSKTRLNHKNVLNEALRQFKKGVAIFVTGPKEIEKTTLRSFLKEYTVNSNELLEILNVNAGIVIVNGADMSNIPKINEGKKSRKENLQKSDDDAARLEFLYEQDRTIYFSSPYALGINKSADDRWMDSKFDEINYNDGNGPTKVYNPNNKFYLPLATVAELPFLRKKAVCAAYQEAEQRYLNDKSEENRKELIAHNSGLRALEYELGFVVNELSICNLCAQAQRQLENVLKSLEENTDIIANKLESQRAESIKRLDDKYKAIVTKLFDGDNSVMVKTIGGIHAEDVINGIRDSEADTIENAIEDISKAIQKRWNEVEKNPTTTVKKIIMENEIVKMIRSTRNTQANTYCNRVFENFKNECIGIVSGSKDLTAEDKSILENCMKRWPVLNFNENYISINESDTYWTFFFFFKFPDVQKCCEKATACLLHVLGEHLSKVQSAICECIKASCTEAKNTLLKDERIKEMNPDLKSLVNQIVVLENQKKAYEELREQVRNKLAMVEALTKEQQKERK